MLRRGCPGRLQQAQHASKFGACCAGRRRAGRCRAVHEPLLWRAQQLPLCSPRPLQIQSITVDDMRAFLATWERPDSAVLGLVGDFEPRQVRC